MRSPGNLQGGCAGGKAAAAIPAALGGAPPRERAVRPGAGPMRCTRPVVRGYITPGRAAARMAGSGAAQRGRCARGADGPAGRRGAVNRRPPTELDLAVRDFGPVASASIAIRPMTILVGPNNSGKTYVATILHSILAAQHDTAGFRRGLADSRAAPGLRALLARKRVKNRRRMVVTGAESAGVLRSMLDEYLCPALEAEIALGFGSRPSDLVRAGSGGTATVAVSERDHDTGAQRKLFVTLGDRLSARAVGMASGYAIAAPPGGRRYQLAAVRGGRRRGGGPAVECDRLPPPRRDPDTTAAGPDMDARGLPDELAMDIMERISAGIAFGAAPADIHQIPATAPAILQVPGSLDLDAADRLRSRISRPDDAQGVAGAAADLLSELALVDGTRGPFSPLADSMDGELFGGSIRLDAPAGGDGCPEIAYHGAEGRVPLRRCSSAISGIAPLSLYLRHVVGRGHMLVLEEPDEHLYPESQLVLAKYLVRLVRGGAGVLVTTHSVFLLEKIAKHLMAGGLSPGAMPEGLGYGRDDYLLPCEVSAYVFEKGVGGGYRTRPIDRDEEYGLSQEEFVRVSEALHHETIVINSKMRARGAG